MHDTKGTFIAEASAEFYKMSKTAEHFWVPAGFSGCAKRNLHRKQNTSSFEIIFVDRKKKQTNKQQKSLISSLELDRSWQTTDWHVHHELNMANRFQVAVGAMCAGIHVKGQRSNYGN